MNIVETEQLTKYYGKSRGIIDLNLAVEEGDFFGFIGPNGAGKSTTIRTLLGLIRATSGSARLFGKDSVACKQEILSRTGFMPSEAMFYSGMRVKELLRFSAGLRKQNCDRQAAELCDRLQLEPGRKIEELSLGNRKKVGIICALQHKPQLYILDEPTSGLDPLMQREFFSLLRERNQEGATIFLSSHILSEIQQHCNRAAIVRKGQMIACDQVAALVKTSAKRVTLHGEADLSGLASIRDKKQTADGVTFLYSGEIGKLLKVLSQGHLTDLTVAEPNLEEVFLHYYGEEGGEKE